MARRDTFDLAPGAVLAAKYRIIERLGGGSEGEVYKIRETTTGLTRAAKLFFPHNRDHARKFVRYARKLDALRDCEIVIKFLNAEKVDIDGNLINCLVSEYFGGRLLDDLLGDYRAKRLPPFEALHLIYALSRGIRDIHARREYHGDIHASNLFVERRGIGFQLRTFDFHDWGRTRSVERKSDILAIVRLLYDITGGRAQYAKQPQELKDICLGLRSDLIIAKFPTIYHLCAHLETFEWA